MNVSIVIPLYNQLKFTKLCLESLSAFGRSGAEIILVDNGSSDGTAEFLAPCSDMTVISNPQNFGCAVAWNQGVKASHGEWVIILNNDVIVPSQWLDGLLQFAKQEKLDIVSPAIREGEYNYDIEMYAREYISKMQNVKRLGIADGICFMVHRSVFDKIGFFDEHFRIGQFEDVDFFRRAKMAGFRLGITGRSLIHHFGSITQKAIRKDKVVRPYEEENRAYYRQKWRLNRWKRFWERRQEKWDHFVWRIVEKTFYSHTLKEKWQGGRLRYY